MPQFRCPVAAENDAAVTDRAHGQRSPQYHAQGDMQRTCQASFGRRCAEAGSWLSAFAGNDLGERCASITKSLPTLLVQVCAKNGQSLSLG